MGKKRACKECFLKGCDCECVTCVTARERNSRLTNLQLTRLSVAAGLEESGVSEEMKKKVGHMLRGVGL